MPERASEASNAKGPQVRRSLRAMFDEWRRFLFGARAERRFAQHASAQLLELYRQQRRAHPEMNKRALYQSIVARYLGPQAISADALVRRAEESFTDWPVERELQFRHVVHYLVFYEYTLQGPARQGTKTNMGAVVARVIPEEI
jgi:hypothetical protein